MSESYFIQILQTPVCVILSLILLVLACGFVLKELHIKHKEFEINVKSKKKQKKQKK